MAKNPALLIENLEERVVPTWGTVWPNATHLTLSFVPDGTLVNGQPSTLFQTMSKFAPSSVWEQEILRAFQTWAVQANINVGALPSTADNGAPLGTAGAVQGDAHFGDIRIAAAPGNPGTVATASAFDWSGSTYTGDVVFNSLANFSIGGQTGYDLYTVATHEAGHVFGFADNSDPTSIENRTYTGVRSGLSAGDIAALQALTGGPRHTTALDADVAGANSTFASANNLGLMLTSDHLNGDLTSANDADFYKFTELTVPGLTGFAVRLQTSGYSLLAPHLTVYDGFGHVLTSVQKSDPQGNDISVYVPCKGFLASTYYVKVDAGTSSTFGVGSYHLGIDNVLISTNLSALLNTVITDTVDLLFITNPNNNQVYTATPLSLTPYQAPGDTNSSTLGYFQGNLAQGANVNYYLVASPAQSSTLTAMVWTANSSLHPILHVFDAAGKPVLAEVITNDGGTYTLQVQNAVPSSRYYVEVTSADGSMGKYRLAVDYHTSPAVTLTEIGSGTLTNTASQHTDTMQVTGTTLFHFVLGAGTTDPNLAATLTLTVRDGQGNVVLTLTTAVGQPGVSADIYLTNGSYTFTYAAQAQNGSALSSLWFNLAADILSDQQGAYTASSSGSSSGGSSGSDPGSSYTYTSSSTSQTGPGGAYTY